MAEWVIRGSQWTLNGQAISNSDPEGHHQAVNVGDTLERRDIGGLPEYDALIVGLEDHDYVFSKSSDPSVIIRHDAGKGNSYIHLEKGSVEVTWHRKFSEISIDEYDSLAVKIRVTTKSASTGSRGTVYAVSVDNMDTTTVYVEDGLVDCEQLYYDTAISVPDTVVYLCNGSGDTYDCEQKPSSASFRRKPRPDDGDPSMLKTTPTPTPIQWFATEGWTLNGEPVLGEHELNDGDIVVGTLSGGAPSYIDSHLDHRYQFEPGSNFGVKTSTLDQETYLYIYLNGGFVTVDCPESIFRKISGLTFKIRVQTSGSTTGTKGTSYVIQHGEDILLGSWDYLLCHSGEVYYTSNDANGEPIPANTRPLRACESVILREAQASTKWSERGNNSPAKRSPGRKPKG